MYALVKICALDLGYILQKGMASPWLGPSLEKYCQTMARSGSAKILPVSQLFMSVQYNFCPLEFHLFQSLSKSGDTVQSTEIKITP